MALEDLFARMEQPAADTPETPRNPTGVSAKPTPTLARTPETPATPENDNIQQATHDSDTDAREAAEERAAILECDGGLSRAEADAIATLAEAFYQHLFGPAKATGCCHAPTGRYCPEGRRLRDAYYGRCQ